MEEPQPGEVTAMKIDAPKFGIACALSVSVLWLVCSILIMVMPSAMLSMSGDMLHMELVEMDWHLTLSGVINGLLGWFAAAGIGGWLLAVVYNRLL